MYNDLYESLLFFVSFFTLCLLSRSVYYFKFSVSNNKLKYNIIFKNVLLNKIMILINDLNYNIIGY